MEIEQELYTFKREPFDPNNLYGFIVDQSDDFILILKEYDFFLDGFQIIRKKDITDQYISNSNVHCAEIIKKEGLLNDIKMPAVDLKTWADIFNSLQSQDEYVIVENELTDDFLIGPIVKLNASNVSIHQFDGTGKWQQIEEMDLYDITSIGFYSNYIKYHRKYISG